MSCIKFSWHFVEDPSKIYQLGDKLKVKVIEIDEKGKVKVSHREFLEKPEDYEERPKRQFNKDNNKRPRRDEKRNRR